MSEQVSASFGATPELHRAARVEDAVHEVVERWLRKRGWSAAVVPYPGYGAPGWVRVMGRVMVTRPDRGRPRKPGKVRGWRSFTTVSAKDAPCTVEVAGRRHEAVANRGGFVDTVVEADLEPGWRTVLIGSGDGEPVEAPVRIVETHPDQVAAVAIRALSPTQSVLAGGLPSPAGHQLTASDRAGKRWLSAPDGAGLWQLLTETGALD